MYVFASNEIDPSRCCCPAPDGCRGNLLDRVKNTDKAFYLIEKEERQFLVTVTDVYVEIRRLEC